MQLPQDLQLALEEELDSFSLNDLIQAREELTDRYQKPSKSSYIITEAQRHAYVFSRMPATYAALISAFRAICERTDFQIKTVLDLGAGPGTAMWAASSFFPSIEKITLIEKDP